MAQKNLDLQILQDTYNLLPDNIEITQKTTYSTTSEGYETSSRLITNERIKMTNYSSYLQFKEAVQNRLKDKENVEQVERSFNNLFTQLAPVYSEGDIFNKVDGLEKLISSEEGYKTVEATFQPTLGHVTLIDIWATWCGPCQNPMAHNQKMLEQNEEKWKDKAVIIGISVDDDAEDVKKRIIDKKWDKIQHYRFVNGWDDNNDTIKSLQLRGIPFVLLLDKKGRIRYRGHPSKTNLEEMINKYIEAGDEEDEKKEEVQAEKQMKAKKKENQNCFNRSNSNN